MKDETLAKTKESYKIYDEIKKAGNLELIQMNILL